MTKILITGGAGFIGANFVHLYARKHPENQIVVLDKLTYAGNLENLTALEGQPNYKFVHGDIADLQFMRNLFAEENFDIVVNFAAETHVDKSIYAPDDFVQTNIIGTHNLLMCAKDNGLIRFHQISTDEVYGDLGETKDTFFHEEMAYDPSSPYSASKAAADLLVNSYFRTFQLPVTISTCSNNYGPYQFPEKLIPYFYKLASEEQSLPLYGDGKNVRDWLYVEDHCEAIDCILERGRLGETYCIGGNNEKQNIEIVRLILDYVGASEDLITYVEDRKGHDRRYAINSSKIKNELGWEPSVTFEEGIQKTLTWYKQNQNWWKDLLAKHNRI